MGGQHHMKTRKLKLKVKLLIPILAINICICFMLGFVINGRAENCLIEMGREQALLVAKEVALLVDGNALAQIVPGAEETEGYKTLIGLIEEKIEGTEILYVYSLYMEDGEVYYGMDLTGEDAVGSPYEDDLGEVLEAFKGNVVVSEEIDSTEDGQLLTALIPMYDSNDDLVAVLGADYNAAAVAGKIRGNKQAVLLFIAIAVAVSGGVVSLLVNGMTGNLKKVNRKLFELANNEGDLTQTIDIRSGDEIELIADNVNKLLSYIHGIMKKISESAVKLEDSARDMAGRLTGCGDHVSDVSATMEELSAAMEETSASIMQVNTSMGEMFEYVEDMAKNANSESVHSESIRIKAEDIRNAAVLAKNRAAEETRVMQQNIREKIEKSKAVEQIASLTSDIISITDQTNLLSLNASIEAARAGDSGRGFAVVADEIGKLANDSGTAAAQIQNVSAVVIEAVTELAGEAANMVELMNKIVHEGFDKLEETGGMYSSDIEGMNHTIQYFAEIAEGLRKNMESMKYAVRDVSVAAEESAKSITNVTEMTVDMTDNICEMGKAGELSEEIANNLNNEVNRFKL